MPVDAEYTSQKNNRLKRLVRNAELNEPNASIASIDYQSGRKLDRNLIQRLASCEYIPDHRNIFITGATGCGKTYLACALGMEACKQFFKTQYVRLPDLLMEFKEAEANGICSKVMKKYTISALLILDEWLLIKPTDEEQRYLLELIDKRQGKCSMIFCSQYRSKEWYRQLECGNAPLTEAILDRIFYNSYLIEIAPVDSTKNVSMREVYGLHE